MRSIEYPKVPTAALQFATATISLLLCVTFFYLINPDAGLSADTKRFLNRAGGALIAAGAVLGAFGFIWSKDNKKKLFLAQRDFSACTEATQRLTSGQQDAAAIAPVLERMDRDKTDALRAMTEASTFEETVAKVGVGALTYVVAGTILQSLAA